MIVNIVHGNIFQTPYTNIAFAVNVEGINDAGFSGKVSYELWADLANIGKKELGDVITNKTDIFTLHALVCHSLEVGGWDKTPEMITKCLDSIDVPDTEIIATVLMGSGMIGKMGGANVFEILGGIARSKKRVAIYTL